MSGPIKVQIFGQVYSIQGELDGKYVQKLAKYVDEKMHDIADVTKTVDTQKVAVLAALAIADALHNIQRDRSAICAMELPAGTSGRSASARATLFFKFSGTKYVLRQSPFGHLLSTVSVPVSVPSSNGTRAIMATFFMRQMGRSASSGFWSKML